MKKKIITITLIALAIFSIIGLFVLIGCNNQSTKKTEINSNTVTHLNSYNAAEDITITDANMTGYKVADVCYCTLNIDKEKAFEKLKDYIVFYDGEPVHVDLDIKVTFKDDDLEMNFQLPNGTTHSYRSSITWIPAYEGVEFMALGTVTGYRFATVIEKKSITTNYDVNKIAKEAFNRLYLRGSVVTTPTFDLTYNDSLQEECEVWSRSYCDLKNGSHRLSMANIRILNDITISTFVGHENNDEYDASKSTSNPLDQHLSPDDAPDINNPDNPNYQGEKKDGNFLTSIKDFFSDGYNNFTEKFQNNETFKIITISVSSILGIGLIYVIFLILRKVWRVIKN